MTPNKTDRIEKSPALLPAYQTKIGHAHLKVRDLDKAIDFYARFLSLTVTERIGNAYAFLTGGDFHHDMALQNVGPEAPQPPTYGTGLYHIAFEVPDQKSLAEAYVALTNDGITVDLVDHLISWAMYFADPDGNGLELYWDTRHLPQGTQLWHGRNEPLPPSKLLSVLPNAEH